MRTPFDPPYTSEDLEQLDALHVAVRLDPFRLESDERSVISQTPPPKKD